MKPLLYSLYALAVVLGAACVWLFHDDIPLSKAAGIADAFRDTAALVFAIIGAWLALFFPEYFAALFSNGHVPKDTQPIDSANLRTLLSSLLISGCVIILNLSILYISSYSDVVLKYFSRSTISLVLLSCSYLSFVSLVYCLLCSIAPAGVVLLRHNWNNTQQERAKRRRQNATQ